MATAKSFVSHQVNTEKLEDKMAIINEQGDQGDQDDRDDQNEKERIAALQERKRREAAHEERNRIKSMLQSTDEEIKKVAELGFEECVPSYALRLEAAFGPVAGMSSHGRVLRWFGFKMTEARVGAYSDTGAKRMTPKELAPYYAAAKDRWVKSVNEAARRGDKAFDDPLSASKRTKKPTADTKRRRSYDEDVDMGATKETTDMAEVGTFVVQAGKKDHVKATPSLTDYGAYCRTCQGTIRPQFPECLCTSLWVPCHSCGTFVALHQKCVFGHEVAYPVKSEALFGSA
eukprot:1984217-Prymnesium_polylepis.2